MYISLQVSPRLIVEKSMQLNKIILKLFIFVGVFSLIFFGVRNFNIIHPMGLSNEQDSTPSLFSAISLIFSIISGFVIQSKWQTWNGLIDATRGELSSFRQLSIMAHHFPKKVGITIHQQIGSYLELVIDESDKQLDLGKRSEEVDDALYDLEDTLFNARKKYPESGLMGFDILARCMTYRERRLQNSAHKLPLGVRIFVVSATIAVIVASLFIGVKTIAYDYGLTLMIGLLSYGIYLLIDDLDHPYRPGDWHLKADEYRELLLEIRKDTDHRK